jgi:hypothetical protein
MTKLATTEQMTTILRSRFNAITRKGELIKRLDPEGVHVCSTHFLHDQPGRVAVRGIWLLKLRNQAEPYELLLDCDVKLWTSLPKHEQVAS